MLLALAAIASMHTVEEPPAAEPRAEVTHVYKLKGDRLVPGECPGSRAKRIAYHALNLADKGLTVYATRGGRAVEANPMWTPVFGRRISALEVGAMTAASSLGYELAFRALRKDCRSLSYFQGAALIVQGGVVGANLRFVF